MRKRSCTNYAVKYSMLAAVRRAGGRPDWVPGPKYIAYVLIFGWSVLAKGAEKLFHGAPNPLSATLPSRHIETYRIYLVTVFRLSSAQTRIFWSPPISPQSC